MIGEPRKIEFISELQSLIEQRRSIRKYKSDDVPKELIEKIIQAGLWAPSGKNLQNWRFVVVTGSKRDAYLKYSQRSWANIKVILEKKLKPSLYEFTERFFYTLGNAPVIIFCLSKNDPNEKYLTSVGSVYMALQNMILTAEAHGLGTCPMGAPLEIGEEVKNFLGKDVTAGLELLCAVTVGYPDHAPPAAPRQTEGRVTWLES
ncbi:MAG: nitroreductase family protein [Oligoflexia bacterium]|nr:nitroreductase family protein [Oligoflexia bacterium]